MMISTAITLGLTTAIALIWVKGIIDHHADAGPGEGQKQAPEENN